MLSLRALGLLLLLFSGPLALAEGWLDWYESGAVLPLDGTLIVAGDPDGSQAGAYTDAFSGDHSGQLLSLSLRSEDWSSVHQAELVLSTRGNFTEYLQVDLRELLAAPARGDWIELTVPSGQWHATGQADWATVNALIVRVTSHEGRTGLVAFRNIRFLQPVLASGAITIAFDDGRSDVYDYAFAQLQERGLTATVYVIPELVGQPTYMTEQQLLELADSGWEIAAHGKDPLTGLSYAERDRQFSFAADWFSVRGFGSRLHYAYPEGNYSEEIIRHTALYFRTGRTIHTGSDVLGQANGFRLGGLSVYDGLEQQELERLVLAAGGSGEWLTVVFHLFSAAPEFDTQFPADRFEAFLDFLVDNGLPVLTTQQAWELNLKAASCTGTDCN